MKKLIWFLIVLFWCGLAWAQPRPGLLIEEGDGSPAGYIYKLLVGSNSLAINNAVGTLTFGADADNSGAVDWDELGNPATDANKSFTFGNARMVFVYSTDDPGTSIYWDYQYDIDSETDTDVTLYRWRIDVDEDNTNLTTIEKMAFTSSGAVKSGEFILNSNLLNFTSIDNIKIGSVSINDLDMGFTVSQSFTDIRASGEVTGKFDSDCGTDATLDVAAATHLGGVACNGDADAIEIDLDAAVVGMSILIVDKAGGAITLDPNGTDVIVYDGTAASAGEAIISSGAKGDFIGLICLTANEWITLGHDANGWTEASP